MLRHLLYLSLLLVSVGYAFLAGSRWERWTAVFFVSASIVTAVLLSPIGQRWAHFERAQFCVDLALFMALCAITLVSERYWPLWMTVLQGVAVLTHAAIAFAPQIVPRVYGNAVQLLGYPMVLLLIVATFRHGRKPPRPGTGGSGTGESSPTY